MGAFWAAAGLILVLISLGQGALSASPSPSAYLFVCLQTAAGLVFLFSMYLICRRPKSLSFRYVLLIGILCRLVLLPSTPLFDNDIYRYLWDGKILAHGINPFMYAPSADELASFRDTNWSQIGYPQIPTIYPPAAQLLFAFAYLLGLKTVLALKMFFFLFDVANMVLIAAVLKRLNRPTVWVMAYAWSPLAAKEFANSGHMEPVMLFFLLTAMYSLLLKPRPGWCGISYAAAITVKFVPVLLAPLFVKLRDWKMLAWAGVMIAALYLPFAGAGVRLFYGAGVYARDWRFNDGAFALISGLQSLIMGPDHSLAFSPARLLAAVFVAGFAVYALRGVDRGDQASVFIYARNVLAACLFLMPAVDPWYVCWLLPFLAAAPSAGLLLFTVTCNLSYLYYAGGGFPVWIPLAEYVPVCLMLLTALRPRTRA